MNDLLTTVWATISKWDWLGIIQALAAIWVAYVATKALWTWKDQAKAERQAKLLDDLIEAVHEQLSLLRSPLTVAEFVKIGMKSHQPTYLGGDQRIAGAVEFIKKSGKEYSEKLFEAIGECRPSNERIRSLMVKGQVLHFKNYVKGYNSATVIAHQLGRMEGMAAMISSSTLNWEHPDVIALLEKILSIDVDQMRKELEDQHREFLTFAKEAYAQIYK